jgi:hypothetical protein
MEHPWGYDHNCAPAYPHFRIDCGDTGAFRIPIFVRLLSYQDGRLGTSITF